MVEIEFRDFPGQQGFIGEASEFVAGSVPGDAAGCLDGIADGFLFSDFIDSMLENVYVVAVTMILGGVILLFIDKWFNKPIEDQTISYPTAFKIGLFQCISMIPGVSRSAATIIGGMTQKLNRKTAAEFSFFLAVPTLVAAGAYDAWKNRALLDAHDIGLFAVGLVAAFVSAFLCVRWLLRFIVAHDFTIFAWYRIVFGIIVLGTAYSGLVNWSA